MTRQAVYDVFLSYRRDGGEMLAKLLHDQLSRRGLRVFLDVESLRSGTFNTKLLDVIGESKDFVLILPPHALDRCQSPKDWVRLEIEHAIKLKKNIIPVMMRGFEWPDDLPASLSTLNLYNGVSASQEYFDAAVEKLVKMLQSKTSGKHGLRNALLAFALVAAALATLFLLGVFSFAPPNYAFKDAYVESLVRSALGKPEGGVTQAELNTVTQLPGTSDWDGTVYVDDDSSTIEASDLMMSYDDNLNVQTLDDFVHMPNLERVNLCLLGHASDLSPLSGLTHLTILDLSYVGEDTPFTNLEALSGLTNLTYLNLYNCSLTDISALKTLTKLELLDVSSNGITDIGPLSGLTSLTALVLGGNEFTDLSPIGGLTNLRNLSIHNGNITDLSALEGLTALAHIDLRSNKLATLDSLPALPNLVDLSVGENNLSDISQLSKQTTLQELTIAYNYPLKDISALLSLPNLKRLIDYQYQNFIPFDQIIQLMDNGCSVTLESDQQEALSRYRTGTYLIEPTPSLKVDDGTVDPDPKRYAPHGVAIITMLNGEMIAAVGNSLNLFQTDDESYTWITVNGKRIVFDDMAMMGIRHTLSEDVVATVTLVGATDSFETPLPYSYTDTRASLSFITADGNARQVRISRVTQIVFDWEHVPDVELSPYFRVTGEGVEAVTPLAGLTFTYKINDDLFTDNMFSLELPLVDKLYLPLYDLTYADFRQQSDATVRVRYATVGDVQEAADTLSRSVGYLHALGGQGVINVPFTGLKRIERVADGTHPSAP